MRYRGRLWVLVVLIAGGVAAEWLRQPSAVWIVAAWLAIPAAAAGLAPLSGWRRWTLTLLLAALAVSLTLTGRQLKAIETRWAQERERRVTAASQHLAGDLHAALHRADRLAEAAISSPAGGRVAAMQLLAKLVPLAGPEMGVVLFDLAGHPWAWAGRHRLPPRTSSDSFAARASGYYVVLEARRHSPDGRSAVASILIWAHPAVPDRERSLAELFRARTEVGLTVYPAGTAPDSADVFDYEEPTTAGPRLLFSVQPVPPEQGAAKELVFHRGSRLIVWLVLASFMVALTLAATPAERFVLLSVVLWLGARAPIGAALGLQPLFSPATFYRPLLGALSASAGVLGLAGIFLTMAGVWLWRRKLGRRWYGIVLGVLLLLVSPYLISSLGRGITPPSRGVPIGLWLTWQLTLLVSASALIVAAASLFRGNAPESHTRWRIVAGVAIALAAALIGVVVWSPRGGWPDWYTFLWTPALLLVTLPAPRWATITGVALVAGSSAALVTWGAELVGRVQVAQRDLARLGAEPDPLALPLLERFAEQAQHARSPANASEMYALWHGSAVGDQGYPAILALWSTQGKLLDELTLDSLDLPASQMAGMVRDLPPTDSMRIRQVVRTPGVHYVLLVRIAPKTVMSAAIGPRTALIPRGRLGRLLDPTPTNIPLYSLTLSPPGDSVGLTPSPRWRREGWSLRRESPLVLGDTTRLVHARINLRGPVPLLVRGALVVLLDAAVLALLWFAAELMSGMELMPPRWGRLAQSFRIRLAVTLVAFFILPAVGFAAWGLSRLADEAKRSRDLLITQALRDAASTAGGALHGESSDTLVDLSRRIDADLALYEGGGLAGTSSTVLEDLGVMDQLMDPAAFRDLALQGELEVTREGSIPQLAERVGYRVVRPGPPETIGVLATPQRASDLSLGVRQLDLAFVLLLATLIGVAAAIAGAQTAARMLSRPVADLRRSALAFGRGQLMPEQTEKPPTEFEPVFAAFERMAHDIRTSQAALEDARRRTAAVLATVGTGVVGVDLEGRVLIANRQAVELLATELREGESFLDGLPPQWEPLTRAVRRFIRDSATNASMELDVSGRRLTLQLASLGPEVRGVVMALNDVTNISRAERVLAWGEMARQVAHEIKNPLTPIRLGMQHLRRVYRERRSEFDGVLDETANRILGEIDRLDTIARAFSRFAAPADPGQALDRVDLKAVVTDVVQLYRLADEGCEVRLHATPGSYGAARQDELKEVLVNLLENARAAGASLVDLTVETGCIRVADNGAGIPSHLLPRVFEPRFSTTTSGSGLGLAIVRRLVDSWGARVEVESEVGLGTSVTIRFQQLNPTG